MVCSCALPEKSPPRTVPPSSHSLLYTRGTRANRLSLLPITHRIMCWVNASDKTPTGLLSSRLVSSRAWSTTPRRVLFAVLFFFLLFSPESSNGGLRLQLFAERLGGLQGGKAHRRTGMNVLYHAGLLLSSFCRTLVWGGGAFLFPKSVLLPPCAHSGLVLLSYHVDSRVCLLCVLPLERDMTAPLGTQREECTCCFRPIRASRFMLAILAVTPTLVYSKAC